MSRRKKEDDFRRTRAEEVLTAPAKSCAKPCHAGNPAWDARDGQGRASSFVVLWMKILWGEMGKARASVSGHSHTPGVFDGDKGGVDVATGALLSLFSWKTASRGYLSMSRAMASILRPARLSSSFGRAVSTHGDLRRVSSISFDFER